MAFILIYVYDEHLGHYSENNLHREKVVKSIQSKIDHLIISLQNRLNNEYELKMLGNKTNSWNKQQMFCSVELLREFITLNDEFLLIERKRVEL